MTLPPQQPGHLETEIVGPPNPTRQLTFSVSIDRSFLPSAGTALGVALVSAAVLTAAIYSRESGDLDVSNFTMGVLGTLSLLGVAAGAHLRSPGSESSATLVSWPGAAGIVGAGAMLAVAINHEKASVYTLGGVILLLSAASFRLTRSAAFTLTAIAGMGVLYVQAFNDLIGSGHSSEGSDIPFIKVGAAILVFVAVVTAAGWQLPGTRVLTGVVVGAGGFFAMTAVFEVLGIAGSFESVSSGFASSDVPGGNGHVVHFDNPYTNDIWITLAYCAALVLFWLACSAVTGHVGFRILAIAMTLEAVPVTTLALTTRHPTWWEIVACGLGGLVLLGVAVRTLSTPAPAAASATTDDGA